MPQLLRRQRRATFVPSSAGTDALQSYGEVQCGEGRRPELVSILIVELELISENHLEALFLVPGIGFLTRLRVHRGGT